MWGVPERDERTLFEFLILEGAQAGLSWSTILRKIDGYRAAFADFDVEAVAAFGDADVERCMADPGHRPQPRQGDLQRSATPAPGSNSTTRSSSCGASPTASRSRTTGRRWTALPAETDESRAMSKELKRRGFRFVGPTICYALMQATGMVNDHLVDCFRHDECRALA